MYEEFTANILPKIAEGLVITKDYFLEFFSRYIKYLLIIDSIYLLVNIIVFITCLIIFVKTTKWCNNFNEDEEGETFDRSGSRILIFILGALITPGFILFSFIAILVYSEKVVKDIYIPEIRIYEEYQDMKIVNNNK